MNTDILHRYRVTTPIRPHLHYAEDLHLGCTVVVQQGTGPAFDDATVAWAPTAHLHVATIVDRSAGVRILRGIHGGPLDARLPASGLPILAVLPLLRQVVAALGAAHEAGCTHPNLSPQAIWTDTQTDGTEFATLLPPSGTADPTFVPYDDGGPVADVHRVGRLLVHLLTGGDPFAGADDPVQAALEGQHTDLRGMGRVHIPLLDWLARRCLAVDPLDRLQSMADVDRGLRLVAHQLRGELPDGFEPQLLDGVLRPPDGLHDPTRSISPPCLYISEVGRAPQPLVLCPDRAPRRPSVRAQPVGMSLFLGASALLATALAAIGWLA